MGRRVHGRTTFLTASRLLITCQSDPPSSLCIRTVVRAHSVDSQPSISQGARSELFRYKHPSLLPDPADEQPSSDLVLPFTEACPTCTTWPIEAAQGILDKHGIKDIDPDRVWWHRFNNTSVSSTKAFLGWEHYPNAHSNR